MSNPGEAFPTFEHEADFCVIGGGMAGLTSAIAAARHGARTVLMHDRSVLGGNASSECRVHICGADRHNVLINLRETGILEEIRLENLRRNSERSWGIWDSLLFEKARYQENLTLLLNCSCLSAGMSGGRIHSVTGWQTTTQANHRVRARIFADASGDGILAPLTGAEFRVGRESRHEFGEPSAPEQADRKTMGMSIMFQALPFDSAQPFEPPAWAHRYDSCDDLPHGEGGHSFWQGGYWWIELGGEHDSIRDTELLRDELQRIVYGVWDHIKNRCKHKERAANWGLDWVQSLPSKRESRRYVGAHILTQNDIVSGGRFDDLVAYGGWKMDDHDPAGFCAVKANRPATVYHKTPSPYGIPYRSLYSRNVPNLMFAGRCHSATHMAMSSTRVMGTGCSMGHAVGTGAAMAVAQGLDPAGMLAHIPELQQELLRDDAYLPGIRQEFRPLTRQARLKASRGDAEPLRDGVNRPVGEDSHAWSCRPGDFVEYVFAQPRKVRQATLLLDSALDKDPQMSHFRPREMQLSAPPDVTPKSFRLEGLVGGKWELLRRVTDNHQRLFRMDIGRALEGVRFVLEGTWGLAGDSRVYAFYVDE
jgi:hypothetical protein